MKSIRSLAATLAGLALLGLAVAHGDEAMDMDMSTAPAPAPAAPAAPDEAPANYFRLEEHSGTMLAHIVIMTISWIFVLPVGVILSIARSRYSLLVQFVFLVLNATGLLLGTFYNASTPDLYPNNSHHKLGWVVTWFMCAKVLMEMISAYSSRDSKGAVSAEERAAFIPISTEAMAQHHRMHGHGHGHAYRYSNDSGQGTERNTASLRSQSISTIGDEENPLRQPLQPEEDDEDETLLEKQILTQRSKMNDYLSKKVPALFTSRALKLLRIAYGAIDRFILILGFVTLATGVVTYSGMFKGNDVFNGLAHWIKGGIFFWYGILTLGRWGGAFAEIGWAWNISPVKPSRRAPPTAEFVESFLIFFYGCTNVFLEHLAAWGGEWAPQDFEHLSITIMFFGGGLCGMFIESKAIRSLLNMGVQPEHAFPEEAEEPKSYRFSMNPMPALIIVLLGKMMSSHTQASMVSSMVHAQWGNLFVGAALARGATYIIYYLSPPASIFPGRPPTELVTAFCLMSGGLLFMASSKDVVAAIEYNRLDAMFMFTVCMGLVAFLMAWIITVMAIKGWAVRKEMKSARSTRSIPGRQTV
ncbi:integral membrane protein-like protein [Xylogone sp. PMI_703]|nr:integral membrane protein-like protein [Xylogone sp. PMI_703]